MMWRHSAIISALLLAVVVGCNSPIGSSPNVSRQKSHLRALLRFHMQAASQGRIPTSEADFKQFIKSLNPASLQQKLENAGVESVDELFISERDGQPYVIFYGQPPKGVERDLIAYEQVGAGGTRYVGFRDPRVEEVDEARFAELVPEAARPTK